MSAPDILRWYIDAITANRKETNFTLSTADELLGLATLVNRKKDDFSGKTITLKGDIDLSRYEDWVPIGVFADDEHKKFSGTFDGAGHIISNLTITSPDGLSGLFGFISGGTVKNLGLTGVNIHRAGEYVGSIAGSIVNYAKMIACYATGAVRGTDKVGGLVGNVGNNSSVTGCYSVCTVSAVNRAGGVVGAASYSDVAGCAALNPEVCAPGMHGRVAASVDSAQAVSNNAAFAGILKKDGSTRWQRTGAGAVDGVSLTADQIKADPTIGGRFKGENGWTTSPGTLPGLGGKTEELPEHLK
ncbi:MAG: hypothetical protein FWB85_05130 [Chitinispirillia bacterium]|nr:hypothetical protein [Chitinispirillia bacterium]MCL2241627.1 hypothetical protein [Chitinispirillia bacterium]